MKYSLPWPYSIPILALLLVGCGFELRDTDAEIRLSMPYTVRVMSLDAQLTQIFERHLTRREFQIVRTNADFIIQVQAEDADNSDDILGKTYEHPFRRLTYRLTFVILNDEGELLNMQRTVNLETDYYHPSGNYLQQEVAKETALNRLRNNAAAEVVNRLILTTIGPIALEEPA